MSRRPLEGKIAPGDVSEWRRFNGDFENLDIALDEVMEKVALGHAYTAQHERYRDKDNFTACQIASLDFDGGDDFCRMENLARDPFIARYGAFIYTTPSHTPERPKARVVFVLDRPVRDVNKYAELAQALVWKYGRADKSCKDPARFFYGSKGCERLVLGNVLTLDVAAKELVLPWRESSAPKPSIQMPPGPIISRGRVPERVLEKHRDSLLERVRTAPNGQKYTELRNASIAFGGYIASGYYVKLDVERWLSAAIRSNPNDVRDIDAAERCIRESLHYGIDRPLFFEDRGYSAVDELRDIHPPLTDGQKAQVQTLIQDKIWMAYNQGMTDGERAAWKHYGIPADVIDMLHLGVRHGDVDEDGVITDEALVIPFLGKNGVAQNVEYRSKDGITYEGNRPSVYYPERAFGEQGKSSGRLIFGDAMDAIHAYLHLGHRWEVGGLPHMTLSGDDADELRAGEVVVVMGSDTDLSGRGLKFLKGAGKFVRLPLPVGKMFQRGFNEQKMQSYLKTAQLWV